MTELEEAMYQQMAYLNLSVGRTFSYFDFLSFEVNGRKYNPKYGTIRNIFSKFKKEGKIKINCNSKPSFYELKECNLTKKSMTVTHTEGINVISHNEPLYNRLRTLPMGHHSIHDIRLRCTAPFNIHDAYAMNTAYSEEKYSGDIRLPCWKLDNATIQIRIHKTNTISTIVACSLEPFPLDFSGIVAFFSTLGHVRGGLVWTLMSIYNQDIVKINKMIPSLSDWIIRMWHFGRDSLIEYSGKDVHDTVERARYVLERIYPKNIKGKHRLREELQECPNKNPYDAINKKLDFIDTTSFRDSSNQLPQIGTYKKE